MDYAQWYSIPPHVSFCCGLVYSSLLFAWDSNLWVTASTVAGVVFSAIAWLFLLNAWLKGLSKYLKNKAVF